MIKVVHSYGNSNESTISIESDSIKTEDTVEIPKSKESIKTTKEYDFKATGNISKIANSKKFIEASKKYDIKETEDTKEIQDSTEFIELQE